MSHHIPVTRLVGEGALWGRHLQHVILHHLHTGLGLILLQWTHSAVDLGGGRREMMRRSKSSERGQALKLIWTDFQCKTCL